MSEASAKATPPRPRRRPPNAAQAGQPQPANVNSVGQILSAAREKRGMSVEQIAEMLKIRRVYLQAIEDSNWEELPELVYAQGFVRSYAAFLNLDEVGAAAQFKREFRGGRRTPELEMPKPMDDHQLPDIKVIISVIVALFVIFVLWSAATAPPANEKLPTVAETQTAEETTIAAAETPATPVASTDATVAADNTLATAPAAEQPLTPDAATPPQTGIVYGATTPTRVTITAAQDSWVQVRDIDGQVVFSRVMRPGDSFRVPNEGTLSLTTGNLAGLHFTIDGKGIAPSGTPGTVQRNLPLAPQNLTATLASMNKIPENTSPNTTPTNNVPE